MKKGGHTAEVDHTDTATDYGSVIYDMHDRWKRKQGYTVVTINYARQYLAEQNKQFVARVGLCE